MKTFYENDTITQVEQKYITAYEYKKEKEGGNELKNKYVSFLLFAGSGILIIIFGYFTTTYIAMIFGGLFFATATLGFIQALIQRKVAIMMNTGSAAIQEKISTDNSDEHPSSAAVKSVNIPPFQLDVYEQNELPDISYALNKNLTDKENILHHKPLHIFYFFNFYSANSLINKTNGGLQRHGPVYFLGSPQDIGFGRLWNMFSIKKIMLQLLITSPQLLAEAIDKVSEKPLPPKAKGLMTENYYSGAYPSNTFYCTDAIWQQCVALLFDKTDFSIIDASDYTTARAGLQWEIGQIINHIATEDFVVLINGKADMVALGESFRKSWKQMNANSPNNREGCTPVRFIFNQWADHVIGKTKYLNPLVDRYHQQALSNDKIIAFMLQAKEKRTLS